MIPKRRARPRIPNSPTARTLRPSDWPTLTPPTPVARDTPAHLMEEVYKHHITVVRRPTQSLKLSVSAAGSHSTIGTASQKLAADAIDSRSGRTRRPLRALATPRKGRRKGSGSTPECFLRKLVIREIRKGSARQPARASPPGRKRYRPPRRLPGFEFQPLCPHARSALQELAHLIVSPVCASSISASARKASGSVLSSSCSVRSEMCRQAILSACAAPPPRHTRLHAAHPRDNASQRRETAPIWRSTAGRVLSG